MTGLELSTPPINILLVDDQPGKLLTYEAMLGQLGANLIKASSGREALEQLLKHEIALVLMDVSMPGLDGFGLAEIIRDHPRFQRTAIMFVSAVHLSDMDRLQEYAARAVDDESVPVVPGLRGAKASGFTELRRKTLETEQQTRDIERRVAERTAELEAAAAQLGEQLQAADRRKDEFLAMLAHELRNPLAPMVNAIGLLRTRSIDDPTILWCRDLIERQTTQLTRLVDDLLDVSRITRGIVPLRPEPCDLVAVVTEAVETSRPAIAALDHEISLEAPEHPVRVNGDCARLVQVVTNLLNNAAKYQAPGGRIMVRLTVAGEVAEIQVRDLGIGMSPELLATAFDPFVQGNPALDRSQGGLGIGLYLVRKLVDLHEGSVVATSAGPGMGSEFVIRLPLLNGPLALTDLPAGRPDRHLAGAAPARILIVDDNEDAADSLGALLGMSGYEVHVAHSGGEALTLARTTSPQLVLLDIGLPGMDGYEVCARLREGGLEHEPIIALTGYGHLERDRPNCRFDGYAMKPVPHAELLALIRGSLVQARRRTSDRRT